MLMRVGLFVVLCIVMLEISGVIVIGLVSFVVQVMVSLSLKVSSMVVFLQWKGLDDDWFFLLYLVGVGGWDVCRCFYLYYQIVVLFVFDFEMCGGVEIGGFDQIVCDIGVDVGLLEFVECGVG